jgi:hypothetical protein
MDGLIIKSFQLSTTNATENNWSWITGKEIEVKPNQQYEFLTHMKLNQRLTSLIFPWKHLMKALKNGIKLYNIRPVLMVLWHGRNSIVK